MVTVVTVNSDKAKEVMQCLPVLCISVCLWAD